MDFLLPLSDIIYNNVKEYNYESSEEENSGMITFLYNYVDYDMMSMMINEDNENQSFLLVKDLVNQKLKIIEIKCEGNGDMHTWQLYFNLYDVCMVEKDSKIEIMDFENMNLDSLNRIIQIKQKNEWIEFEPKVIIINSSQANLWLSTL